MSSAVESFGPASAAAAHPYAHHNHFAIAAAAAGSATAAAAAIIPSHHHHHHHQSIKLNTATALEHQFGLNHSSIYSNTSVSSANNHISNPHLAGGLFLPPPPPPLSMITSSAAVGVNTLPTQLVLSSKCSPQEQPKSPRDRSPRSKTASFQVQDGSCASNMSSAEFARPHPKQPRYTNNNNNINTINNNNNNNNINNNNNNNTNSHLNNNYTSNAIPLHLRPTKVATGLTKNYNNTINSLNNNNISTGDKTHCSSSTNHLNNHSHNNNNSSGGGALNKPTSIALPRAKYSNEQSGPVNLVTNNNTNLVNQNSNHNHNRSPPTSLSSDISTASLVSDVSESNRKPVPTDMYAQKMPFTAQSLAAPGPTAYPYNYPIYGSRPLYGTPLFPTHHGLGHHNTIRPCPTYLSSQHEAFSPYHQAAAGVYQTSVQPQANIGIHRTAPQVLINNSSLSQASKPSSPLERICSYPQSNSKEISKTNGTYLNGKVNTSPAAPESVTGFKVPSGKEGSLKHRILTRPSSSDRDATKRRSPITASVVKSSSNSSTSNFTKGACIELANGVLRRVEDMRTEDFIQSAEKSPIHQLAESTVVKITATSGNVTITFSYDKNRSKADVEVSQEHPFFVYGQGWASCNPELTLKSFGLKCQRLQVGDICISLKTRDTQSSPPSLSNNNNNNQQTSMIANCNQTVPSQNYEKSDASLPQNLSRKLPPQAHSNESTIPVATTINNVASRLANMGAPTYIPTSHNPYKEAAAAVAYENQISRHNEYYQAQLQLHNPYHRLMGHPDVALSSASRVPLPPPQSHSAPVQQSRPTSNQSSYYPEAHVAQSSAVPSTCDGDTQQQPVDASLSRKRRWSAPESICDDDENECSPPAAHRLSNTNAYNS